MSVEVWAAIAAWGTFVVITASAVAALIQLRHLRTSNELSGLISVTDQLQDPANRELFNFVRQDLRLKLQDESFMRSLDDVPADRRRHPELYVCQLYEHIAAYVRHGLIDEEAFMLADWYDVQLYWTLLSPVIDVVRRKRPFVFENFEWLATRARIWVDAHPRGNYPKGSPRMAVR